MTHPYRSNIPLARKLIERVINMVPDHPEAQDALWEVLNLMYRHKHIRNAPRISRMTPAIKQGILKVADENPDMTEQAIGEHFGVSGGRVSEVLHGR